MLSKNSRLTQHSDLRSIGNGTSTCSSSGYQSAQQTPGPVYNAPIVAKSEERNILRAKRLVALILVLATATVATSAYILVRDQARSDFENQFAAYASKIGSVSRQKADKLFDALDAFAAMVGSQAAIENELLNTSWPFYTVPDFSIKAERLDDTIDVTVTQFLLAPIVQENERDAWANYANSMNPVWYQESLENEGNTDLTVALALQRTIPFIHTYDIVNLRLARVEKPGEVLPCSQQYPLRFNLATNAMAIGFDALSLVKVADQYEITKKTLRPTIGFARFLIDSETLVTGSQVMQPIYDTSDTTAEYRNLVAIFAMQLDWREFFKNILTQSQDGVVVVLRSDCSTNILLRFGINETDTEVDHLEDLAVEDVITYQVDGPDVVLLGYEDLHDPRYDALEATEVFVDLGFDKKDLPEGKCVPTLTLHFYPSEKLEATFRSAEPAIYASVIVVIFVFTSLVFLLYVYFVGRRQRIAMERIVRQDKIVTDVFPTAIRDRLYEAQNQPTGKSRRGGHDLLAGFEDGSNDMGSAPLADLFPSVSVVFADIVGFTAWSSAREPQQVFLLLESIYHSFDKIAYRHDIFKVETVSDCYVAAAGLPEPVDNHAVLACKFALDCLKKMRQSTIKLEVSLGPDTADLALRIGIHSGQVTAGVLRGERSRFQLFGDTMNTASRLEHSGEKNRVQISQATADLLAEAGLSHWTTPRERTIYLKGKGDMQTYWMRKTKSSRPATPAGLLTPTQTVETVTHSELTERSEDSDSEEKMDKTERLVEWTVAVLTSLLQQIIASRGGDVQDIKSLSAAESGTGSGRTALEEFVPIIPLKRFDEEEVRLRPKPASIDIGDEARSQLRNYLFIVAGMYHDNPFHNFDHAIHVTASVKKLLARIVNMDERNGLEIQNADSSLDSAELVDLAGHSYGITSDPLTQFAVVFSAIIHDVDHPGVPNTQLVKENTRSAQVYKKSVAEQNSVHLAWDILMSDKFSALRACIYQTESELRRFRQLVVNTVLATDIVDKELQALRRSRWKEAFSNVKSASESPDEDVVSEDRKATIVIEHLIQASDVSHTMQHWHIYKTWNEKFFMECYGAYKGGRADSDPSEKWYRGEIGFFDFYVIPLAKKLDSCGVFGVSSDEYLNYAISNREEWVREGEAIVDAYIAKFNKHQC
eukprot:scaffold3033_cov91-Cylindrotheca_fusiformis.AAC.2